MNTLKFLAVGSSLDSGREVVGRYRVREASLLPRFEPDVESASIPTITSAGAPSWWRRILNLFRSAATSRAAAPEATQATADPGEPTNGSDTRDRERGPREIPLVSTAKTLASPMGDGVREPFQKPVQHEFRFENVTVVCNDLHDADFEIVSMPRRRRSPVKATDQRAVVHA